MKLPRMPLFTLALSSALVACAIQTEFHTGPPIAAPASPVKSEPRAARGPTHASDTRKASGSAQGAGLGELRPITEREMTGYRSLIAGDDDRVVLDPKLVNATDNVFTESLKSTVASLEGHAARYDVTAAMASHPPCETSIEAVLNEEVNDPIRRDEDDVQFKRRRESASRAVELFHRALNSSTDASRADLKFAYALFVTKFDSRGQLIGGIPRPRTALQGRLDAVSGKELCHAKYLLVVNDWWKRQRADLDAKRQAAEAAGDAENRKVVLARRFAPVRMDCAQAWRGTTTKCDELPGLSDDEKKQCAEECKAAAEEGFKKSFESALGACVNDAKDGPKSCELAMPAGSTITNDAVAKSIATCKSDCAAQVRDGKEEAAKEHQECLAFCRDLKDGFCAMTERTKQPACIGRCITGRCSQ